MELVDLDVGAARRAVQVCEKAASELDAVADRLGRAPAGSLARWSGDARRSFDGAADDLVRALRREAAELEETAEAIRRSLVRAEAEDDRRRSEREAQARRLEEAQRREQEARRLELDGAGR